MEGLMPCPFCGGDAEFEVYGSTACAVVCQTCHCGTPTVVLDDGMRAVEAWNHRAERTCRMLPGGTEDVCVVRHASHGGNVLETEFRYRECSECGANVFDCPTVAFCPVCGAKVVDQ